MSDQTGHITDVSKNQWQIIFSADFVDNINQIVLDKSYASFLLYDQNQIN